MMDQSQNSLVGGKKVIKTLNKSYLGQWKILTKNTKLALAYTSWYGFIWNEVTSFTPPFSHRPTFFNGIPITNFSCLCTLFTSFEIYTAFL